MRYAFAGDRLISVQILDFLIKKGFYPLYLIVSDGKLMSHSEELIKLSCLSKDKIIVGKEVNSKKTIDLLFEEKLDYIIGIHFPYIICKELLKVPKIGFLNLHPAYLPFNKGWHTPTWAILDNTPYGATLHFMTDKLDEGDIIHQLKLEIKPEDSADQLYKKVLDLEYQVFKESLNELLSLNPNRTKQKKGGTAHLKKDLKVIQELDLKEKIVVEDLINKMRALSTNNKKEFPYFIKEGIKYYLKLEILKE